MDINYGGIPGAKYVYIGWALCFLSVRYDIIPVLSEFVTSPLLETSFATLTVFSVYTAVVLAIISAGGKGFLHRFSNTFAQTTVTTVIALVIIALGLIAAGDIVAACVMKTDPFVIEAISHFAQDPTSLEDFARMGLNETLNNSNMTFIN